MSDTAAKLAASTAVPIDRSIPPPATTKVMPIDMIARRAKLLTSTLSRLAGVGNAGATVAKNANTSSTATTSA